MHTLFALIAALGPTLGDGQAPTVEIFFPLDGAVTGASTLAVTGSAEDASQIVSIVVNGVPARSSDGFRHWRAEVPIGDGEYELVVASVDVHGNVDPSAATSRVIRDGPYPGDWWSATVAPDGKHAYAYDPRRSALFEIELVSGLRRIVSDPSTGSGASLQTVRSISRDPIHTRLIVVSGTEIVAVDLATGDRNVVSSSSVGGGVPLWTPRVICVEPDGLHAILNDDAFGQSHHLKRVELATGDRTVVSGQGVGTGPKLGWMHDIALDPSGSTVFVSCDSPWRIVAVRVADGARRVLSKAGVGAGPWTDAVRTLDFDASRGLIVAGGPRSVLGIDPATGDRTELVPLDSPWAGLLGGLPKTNHVLSEPSTGRLLVFADDVVRIDPATQAGEVVSHVARRRGVEPPDWLPMTVDPSQQRLWFATNAPLRTEIGSLDLRTGAQRMFTTPSLFGEAFRGWGPCDFVTGRAWLFSVASYAQPYWCASVDLDDGTTRPLSGLVFPDWSVPQSSCVDPVTRRPIVVTNQGASSPIALWRFDSDGTAHEVSGPNVGQGPPLKWPSLLCAEADGHVLYVSGNGYLTGIDVHTGDRWTVSAYGTGSGQLLGKTGWVDFDDRRRRVVVWSDGTDEQHLIEVDPATGDRVLRARGECFAVPAADWVGAGAPLDHLRGLTVDDRTGVAYARSYSRAVLAIELESGDRVVVSR